MSGVLHQRSVILALPDRFIGGYVANALRLAGAEVTVLIGDECEVDRLLDGFTRGGVIASSHHARVLEQAIARRGGMPPVLVLIGASTPEALGERNIPLFCYPFAAYHIVDTLRLLFDCAGSFGKPNPQDSIAS